MSDVKVTKRKAYDPERARQDQAETLDRTIPFPWRCWKLIENITMTPSEQRRVTHGLKRKPKGWIIVRPRQPSGAGMVWEQLDLTDTTALGLTTNIAITFDLWVW